MHALKSGRKPLVHLDRVVEALCIATHRSQNIKTPTSGDGQSASACHGS